MAYLDRQRLTCPGCGKTGSVVFVVGIGPQTRPGEGPSYVTLQDAGPWVVDETNARPVFVGRLNCPDCGAEVLNRSDSRTV